MSISDLETDYMRAHSKYLRLVDSNAPEKDIIAARELLDELGNKVNEEYKNLNESCKKLMDKKVKTFYISTLGDINEIERLSNIWANKGIFPEKGPHNDILFYNITRFPVDLEDIMRSLLNFKSIKLTKIEFDISD